MSQSMSPEMRACTFMCCMFSYLLYPQFLLWFLYLLLFLYFYCVWGVKYLIWGLAILVGVLQRKPHESHFSYDWKFLGAWKTMQITSESLEKRDLGLIIMRRLVLWMFWSEPLLCLHMHPVCWTWNVTITSTIVGLLRRLCYTIDWKRTDGPRHLIQGTKSELHVTKPVLHVDTWDIWFISSYKSEASWCACHSTYVLIWAQLF